MVPRVKNFIGQKFTKNQKRIQKSSLETFGLYGLYVLRSQISPIAWILKKNEISTNGALGSAMAFEFFFWHFLIFLEVLDT